MKKTLLLAIALVLTAVLATGCSLLPLALMGQTNNRQAEVKAEYDVEEALVDEGYTAYEYEAGYGDAMAPTGIMPAPNASMYLTSNAGWDDFNTEEYAAITENGFQSVATSPLSTFSADVDTASYCNLRRMLNEGWRPADMPSGSVRIEEMLNYFRYDYRKPEGDERFAAVEVEHNIQRAGQRGHAEERELYIGLNKGLRRAHGQIPRFILLQIRHFQLADGSGEVARVPLIVLEKDVGSEDAVDEMYAVDRIFDADRREAV